MDVHHCVDYIRDRLHYLRCCRQFYHVDCWTGSGWRRCRCTVFRSHDYSRLLGPSSETGNLHCHAVQHVWHIFCSRTNPGRSLYGSRVLAVVCKWRSRTQPLTMRPDRGIVLDQPASWGHRYRSRLFLLQEPGTKAQQAYHQGKDWSDRFVGSLFLDLRHCLPSSGPPVGWKCVSVEQLQGVGHSSWRRPDHHRLLLPAIQTRRQSHDPSTHLA